MLQLGGQNAGKLMPSGAAFNQWWTVSRWISEACWSLWQDTQICSTQYPKDLPWHWSIGAHSANLLINTPISFLSFLAMFPRITSQIKLPTLQSFFQGPTRRYDLYVNISLFFLFHSHAKYRKVESHLWQT